MCSYAAWGLAIAAASAGVTGYSSYRQSRTQEQVADYNARMQEIRAERIKKMGTAKENAKRAETQRAISMQQVETASGGVRVGSGGALQLQKGVRLVGNAEALQIRKNFLNKASSIQQQSTLTRARGDAMSNQTLLAGVGNSIQAGVSGYRAGYGMASKLKLGKDNAFKVPKRERMGSGVFSP